MKDPDIRTAMHRKVLARYKKDPDSRIVDELGLMHGSVRADIAVVNGKLHGFEIKSEADTLSRLPSQLKHYCEVFDRMTIVCAECHLKAVRAMVPRWWGIKLATQGPRGGVHFRQVRYPRTNPKVSPISVARLLWRDEAIRALTEVVGLKSGVKSKNRETLYRMMADHLRVDEICAYVRETLKVRQKWRADLAYT